MLNLDNEKIVEMIQKNENIKENMMILYNKNKGMLYKLMRKYVKFEQLYDINDMMQEAYIYLDKAVRQYDTESGVKFITYLTNVINWNIGRDIRQRKALKVPESLNADIRKYMEVQEKYTSQYDRKPTQKEYMKEMNVVANRVKTIEKAVCRLSIESIDTPVNEFATMGDMIQDNENAIEDIEIYTDCKKIMKIIKEMLTEKEYKVFYMRYNNEWTFEKCAEYLGTTQQGARYILKKAESKIQKSSLIK